MKYVTGNKINLKERTRDVFNTTLVLFTISTSFILISSCSKKEFQSTKIEAALEKPKKFSIMIENYCLPRTTQRVSFYAFNKHYTTSGDGMIIDSDGDGISDIDEKGAYGESLGLDAEIGDSNNDGYDDVFIFRSGLDVAEQSKLKECDFVDADFDGIPNCQELLLRTKPDNADSDGDGIPDGLELRLSLNPTANEAELDSDMDDLSNAEEAKFQTPHLESNKDKNFIEENKLAYNLENIESTKNNANTSGEHCYRYTVNNISYVMTKDENTVELIFGEAISNQVNFKRFVVKANRDEINKGTVKLPTLFKIEYANLTPAMESQP